MGRMTTSASGNWMAQARFQQQCRTDNAGCWVRPKANRDKYGYDANGYRRAWQLWIGPFPPTGQQIEHRCGRGKHGCVNPFHLEAITNSENRLRAVARQSGQMSRHNLRMARILHQGATPAKLDTSRVAGGVTRTGGKGGGQRRRPKATRGT